MMLSKKILLLKKKIKKLEKNYIDKFIDQKLSNLNEKIKSQDDIIKNLESKVLSLESKEKKEIKNIKSGISLLLDTVTDLEDYRETCSKDISTLASAISELYNILNYMLGGKLLKKKEVIEEDEIYFEEDLDFDEYIDESGKKKKKKVYH